MRGNPEPLNARLRDAGRNMGAPVKHVSIDILDGMYPARQDRLLRSFGENGRYKEPQWVYPQGTLVVPSLKYNTVLSAAGIVEYRGKDAPKIIRL
jgi:hypothetical protein